MSSQTEKKATVGLSIVAAGLLALTGVFSNKCINVMFPDVAHDFSVSIGSTQWLISGFMMTNAITAATAAYLLKKIAAQKIELVCAILFCVGALMDALAPSFPILIAGRIIQGIALGPAMPLLWFLIFTEISKSHVGTISGWIGAAIGIACTIGPLYAGWVSDLGSWRLVFWTLLVLAIISLILGQISIRVIPEGTDYHFSFSGLAFLAICFSAFDITVSSLDEPHLTLTFWLSLIIGFLFLGIFVFTNNRGKARLFNLKIFAIPAVAFSALAYFLFEAINVGMQALVPTYAQCALRTSALLGGFVIIPGSILGSFGSVIAGKWADKKGYDIPIILGASSLLFGIAGTVIFQKNLAIWSLLLLYIFQRVGFSFGYQNIVSHASLIVPASEKADVSSLFSVIANYSGSVGAGLLLSLFEIGQDSVSGSAITKAFAGGHIAFLYGTFGAILMLLFTILSFVSSRKKG
ncbi:MAG: MFS transporter [Aeriscardovia sp.]|nr:MFS transporter [Aeriscardovia sp.]MBR3359557.1 MFS transporter [Aeriscardovia sp.]